VKGCPWFFRFGVGHEPATSFQKAVYIKKHKDEYWIDNLRKLLGKCYVGAESDEVVTKGK
jgi:hypothetical protein